MSVIDKCWLYIAGHILEIQGSVQYWQERALFMKKGTFFKIAKRGSFRQSNAFQILNMPCKILCQNLDRYIQILNQNLDSQHQELLVIVLSIFLIEILLWVDLCSQFIIIQTIKKFYNKDFQKNSEQAWFELTYRDSGNTIHFSIFTMQFFPSSQKITITKYNAVSYSKTDKPFFLLLLKTISI